MAQTIRSQVRETISSFNRTFTIRDIYRARVDSPDNIRRWQLRNALCGLVCRGEIRIIDKVDSKHSPTGFYNLYEKVKLKAPVKETRLGLFLYSDEELLTELKRRLSP
jgi:hypothetical protein